MPRQNEPPLSAPGLVGGSLQRPPMGGGARARKRPPARPYSHARLEGEFPGDGKPGPPGGPGARAANTPPRDRQGPTGTGLTTVTAAILHVFAGRHFRSVDRWELRTGGWLPLLGRRASAHDDPEPVGDMLDELEKGKLSEVENAKGFVLQLSGQGGNRADVDVHRRGYADRFAIVLDLWGRWSQDEVRYLTWALDSRLPSAKVTLTRYRYA